MLLTLPERYAILSLLPKQGGFKELARIKSLMQVLPLGETEADARGLLATEEGIISSDEAITRDEISQATEVPVDNEVDVIVSALKQSEMRGVLPLALFDLFDKLINQPNAEAVNGKA